MSIYKRPQIKVIFAASLDFSIVKMSNFDFLNCILSKSHWHNEYTTAGNKFPIMKNHLALMINPKRYKENITSDILTKAIKPESNLLAWCDHKEGNMFISNDLLPFDSARKFCEGIDFEKMVSRWCKSERLLQSDDPFHISR